MTCMQRIANGETRNARLAACYSLFAVRFEQGRAVLTGTRRCSHDVYAANSERRNAKRPARGSLFASSRACCADGYTPPTKQYTRPRAEKRGALYPSSPQQSRVTCLPLGGELKRGDVLPPLCAVVKRWSRPPPILRCSETEVHFRVVLPPSCAVVKRRCI